MKLFPQILCTISCTLLLTSCGDGGSSSETDKKGSAAQRINTFVGGSSDGTVFIPKDSANKMIQSYLTSINSQENDTLLRSLIFDADSLRAYLSDPTIKHVKVMFAHTLDYINAKGSGNNVGYESGALTMVFGGYDANGNYVFWQTNRVPDRSDPCPTACPAVGNASSDLFPTNN